MRRCCATTCSPRSTSSWSRTPPAPTASGGPAQGAAGVRPAMPAGMCLQQQRRHRRRSARLACGPLASAFFSPALVQHHRHAVLQQHAVAAHAAGRGGAPRRARPAGQLPAAVGPAVPAGGERGCLLLCPSWRHACVGYAQPWTCSGRASRCAQALLWGTVCPSACLQLLLASALGLSINHSTFVCTRVNEPLMTSVAGDCRTQTAARC